MSDSGLERYAAVFNAAEINSTFYRPHRRSTYERWAASVPADFAFAVKLPRTITHEARLIAAEAPLARFLEETDGLGKKRGPILIQLPPSLAFEPAIATDFFALLRDRTANDAACEPRHRSWFAREADELLARYRVARVAADPAPTPGADQPGGWLGLRYSRWHGSPQMYRSAYDAGDIERLATELRRIAADGWAIFDNTMTGAATLNALSLREAIGDPLP
ncbi:MAG: DUF72 domain-containing protein [Sphingomonas sp.]|uniref:DUF72 domain-containing protein n=1 Tax=Sphingomonas sp. TaxID=28214 RepID=UPI003F7EC8A9